MKISIRSIFCIFVLGTACNDEEPIKTAQDLSSVTPSPPPSPSTSPMWYFYRGLNSDTDLNYRYSEDGMTWAPTSGANEFDNGADSDNGPSVIYYNNMFIAAYKDDNTNYVYTSTSTNGINWTANTKVPVVYDQNGCTTCVDVQTAKRPLLLVIDGEIYLFFINRTGGNDKGYIVWTKTSNLTTWTNVKKGNNIPEVMGIGGIVHNGISYIFSSIYDYYWPTGYYQVACFKFYPNQNDFSGGPLMFYRSSTTPSCIPETYNAGYRVDTPGSNGTISAAVYNNELYIAFRGVEQSGKDVWTGWGYHIENKLFLAKMLPSCPPEPNRPPTNRTFWKILNAPDGESLSAPSIGAFNNKLYYLYSGINTQQLKISNSTSATSWPTPTYVVGSTSGSPCLVMRP